MVKKHKKGFTIVELVVVIAVIAILAAVLIPTFVNLVHKAEFSNDQALVRNINTTLAISAEGTDGKPTMYDTLVDVQENGFVVENLTPRSSGSDIVWDEEHNQFVLVYENGTKYFTGTQWNKNLNTKKMWKIYTTMPTNSAYSIYLTGTTYNQAVTVDGVGFDAGRNTNIPSVSYTNTGDAQNVTIRTQGGDLIITAKNDTVNHYGEADSVSVVDIDTESYHENGTVKFLEVTAGHIVLEKDAVVSAFHFTATGTGDDAKFQNAQGKKISIDISKVPEEKLPEFSRDPVTIAENGTYVAEVKSDTTEYIWLFGKGIKEQMVVSSTKDAIATGGELKEGITAGCENGSVAEQIANPANRNSNGQLVASDGVTPVTPENAVVEEVASKEDVQTGATLFGGGSGTQLDPFLIVDYDTFQHVSDLYEEGYYYFKVKDGIETIDCKNWVPVFLYGSIDGNGVTLNNLDKWLFDDIIYGDGTEQIIHDMTVNCRIIVYGYGAAALCDDCIGNVTFENVDVNGYIEGRGNSAVYVAYGSWDANNNTLHFKNCGGNATLLVKQNGPGIYMGHHGTKTSIIIEDCHYSGAVYTPDGKSRTTTDYTTSSWASFTEIENGVELAKVQYGKLYANTSEITYTTKDLGSITFGDNFEINASTSSSYAVAEFMIAPNGNGVTVLGGGYTATYMSEELTISNGKYSTSEILYYHVAINPSNVEKTGLDTTTGTFNVVNSSYNNTYSSASVMITEYDVNNNVIAVWVWSLPVE